MNTLVRVGSLPDIRDKKDVKTFQRLWNRSNPNDKISEDGVYGPQTEACFKKAAATGLATGFTTGIHRTSHKHEGLIICRDHLQQIVDAGDVPVIQELPANVVEFWGERCLMCGVDASPGRLCESVDCRRPLHPQWPVVYCCNDCALDDV